MGSRLARFRGGECQRIKLASELHKSGSIYVMDEPTTGLHMSDVGNLLAIMNRLVDGGNSVIVIEHNLDVIKNADWIIDLGPDAGHDGGQIIFTGTPQQLVESTTSLTGEFLRREFALGQPEAAVTDIPHSTKPVEVDIFALARNFEAYIAENWEMTLETNRAKLARAYAEAGDSAYGTYLDALFRPIHRQLREMGLKAKPRLPGEFSISREWGVPTEDDEQRWMWSTIVRVNEESGMGDGEPIGTLVTVVYHDHTQFRLPRTPHLFALSQVGKEAVVEELSRRSEKFKHALEFTLEYELYLQKLAEAENSPSEEQKEALKS